MWGRVRERVNYVVHVGRVRERVNYVVHVGRVRESELRNACGGNEGE